MPGKFVLAVGRRPELRITWASPQGCSSARVTWQLASLRVCDSLTLREAREHDGSHNVFYDLASEVTRCHFHNILLVTQVNPT